MAGSAQGPTIHEIAVDGVDLTTAADKIDFWTPRPINIIRFGVVHEGTQTGDLVLTLNTAATCTAAASGSAAGQVRYRDRAAGDTTADWEIDVGGQVTVAGDGGPTAGTGTVFLHYIEEPIEHETRGGSDATPVTS